MASQYHKMKYPYLYADPGLARAVTGSGITPLLLSDLEPGGKYGGKISYNGKGTGIDPLNLAGKGGKGTGIDLFKDTNSLIPKSEGGVSNFYEDKIMRDMENPPPKLTEDSLNDFEIKMKKKPERKEEEAKKEDDKPKGLKDYMAKIFEDGDALIALGGAIARGEGLVGGLEEFSKTRKETEATEYARQVAKYERERQQELDVLQKASTLAEIAYKESQMTSDDQKIAMDLAIQTARSQGVTDINSEAFAKIYAEAIDTVVQKEKPITLADIAENIGMSAIGANQDGGVAMNIPIVTMAGTPINQ